MALQDPSRRDFVAALCAATAAACLPRSSHAAAPDRTTLSRPLAQLAPHYSTIVVGSGYGGSICAARLAGGGSLALLERGREWQPRDFPASSGGVIGELRSAVAPLGLFDYRAGTGLDALVGNGLDGTSLINANVVIAPDRDVFARWPAALRDAYASGTMDAYEQRVRSMLAAEAIAAPGQPRKTGFHASTTARRGRAGAGVEFQRLPLAANLSRYPGTANAHGVVQPLCSRCGDCVSGCRVGAKNTLDVNYLRLAAQRGAEIYTRIEVEFVERAGTLWRLHYIARPAGAAPYRGSVLAGRLVLAAGALGSSQILLRSAAQGLPLPAALGSKVSANGDYLGVGYNTRVQTDSLGVGDTTALFDMRATGPTITSAARYAAADPAQRYLIEEGAWPQALVDALRVLLPPLAAAPDTPAAQRELRDLAARRANGALNHSMVYLGIGHDSAGGRLELDTAGNARIRWPGIAGEPFVQRLREEMRRHAELFGGSLQESPRAHPVFGAALTTVHPLGGCPLGSDAGDGVVDSDGRVFDPRGSGVHGGLYVADGAILPGSVGVNPLLTISALAERLAERMT